MINNAHESCVARRKADLQRRQSIQYNTMGPARGCGIVTSAKQQSYRVSHVGALSFQINEVCSETDAASKS